MRVKDALSTLLEAPLPDDWDASIYNDRVPFRTRVGYAKERAEQVGRGSARVAMVVPYQGRKTVLKLAMNAKGAAQNEAETELLDDYYLRGLGVVIPMIDYDEKSRYPTWIHMEFAEKIKKSDIVKATGGGSLSDLMVYCAAQVHSKERFFGGDASKVDPEKEFVQDMLDFYGNYHTNVKFADLTREANWGMYKGKPVIVDLGLNQDVWTGHYRR